MLALFCLPWMLEEALYMNVGMEESEAGKRPDGMPDTIDLSALAVPSFVQKILTLKGRKSCR